MEAARRLSGILMSPLRVMNDVGSKVADMLVPDAPVFADVEPAAAAAAPPPPAQQQSGAPAKRLPATAADKTARIQKASPALKAVTKKSKTIRSPPIKKEAVRDQPFRSQRLKHKAGFYSQANLEAIAWRGTGAQCDPILLEE